MATEDFKMLTEELFNNYVSLHKKIEEGGHKVNLSFREYLDFYISYQKEGLEEYLDYEELDSEEDSE